MIELRVNGRSYGGWKEARVARGVDRAAGDFSLTVSDRWPGQSVPQDVRPGDACQVMVNGQTVITGYVDEVKPNYGPTTHEVQFSGRSKTADLVDCSVVHSSGQWSGASLRGIVRDLVSPFGLSVVEQAPLTAGIPDFQIQPGETAFNALERVCAVQGLLVCDDARGNVVFARAGTVRGTGQIRFKRGDAEVRNRNNVLNAAGTFSWRERFSRYIVKGQAAATDDWNGLQAAGVEAEVSDTEIGRYRPLIVIAEEQVGGATAQQRAKWERSTRRGKGLVIEYTVQGWVQDTSGTLWEPNTLVSVDDDYQQVRGTLLIAGCTYQIGQSGSTTVLRVCAPEAFDVLKDIVSKGYTSKWSDLRTDK